MNECRDRLIWLPEYRKKSKRPGGKRVCWDTECLLDENEEMIR